MKGCISQGLVWKTEALLKYISKRNVILRIIGLPIMGRSEIKKALIRLYECTWMAGSFPLCEV